MSLKSKEARIRKCAAKIEECGLEIGAVLIEIEKEGDWKEKDTDYDSFDAYLQGEAEALTGKSYQRCRDLMNAKQVSVTLIDKSSFGATHFQELARVCPKSAGHGGRTQITKKDAKVMEQAATRAQEIAEEKGKDKPSVRDVRAAVQEVKDASQGVNQEQRQARDEESSRELIKDKYLQDLSKAVKASHDLKRLISESNVSLVKMKKTQQALDLVYADVMDAIEQASIYHPSLMEEEV